MTKVRFKDLPDSDQGDFRCRRAVDSSNLVKISGLFSYGSNGTIIWHAWSCRNYKQKHLGVEYNILDSELVSNKICVLFVYCKIVIFIIVHSRQILYLALVVKYVFHFLPPELLVLLMGAIDIKLALAQVTFWHQIGSKPLPEPMMTHFYDVIWHHHATMS